MFVPIVKLHNWIYRNKFDETSIELLKKNNDIRINWSYIILNVNSTDKLKENIERIHWVYLSKNPSYIKVTNDDNEDEKND
jgi:hypothetical protein